MEATEITALLWAVLGFKLGILFFSHQIPDAGQPVVRSSDGSPIGEIFRRPEVLAFFAACLLMAAAHGPYYTFYSIYLVEQGYSKSTVGLLWATGVACEIGIFFLMPQLMRRFDVRQILVFSFSCATARFLMIGWGTEWPFVILLAQVLHAATYGAHHAAAMVLVHRFFSGRHQAKGQALYTGLAFGVGGTLGGILSGYGWQWLGPRLTFTISATAALAGLSLIVWRRELTR